MLNTVRNTLMEAYFMRNIICSILVYDTVSNLSYPEHNKLFPDAWWVDYSPVEGATLY